MVGRMDGREVEVLRLSRSVRPDLRSGLGTQMFDLNLLSMR